LSILFAALLAVTLLPDVSAGRAAAAEESETAHIKHRHHHKGHHRGHHRHHHHHEAHTGEVNASTAQVNASHADVAKIKLLSHAEEPNTTTKAPEAVANTTGAPEGLSTTKAPESSKSKIAAPESSKGKIAVVDNGLLRVNAPLPPDFAEIFAEGIADATGCKRSAVTVVSTRDVADEEGKLVEVRFEAPAKVVQKVLDQAADDESQLASGVLCPFLVAKVDGGDDQCQGASKKKAADLDDEDASEGPATPGAKPAAGVKGAGFDVDTAMPYGDLEPFGREDTAQELTESSIKESNAMVDQLERAEVAEEKRAVFRALTRLRGAAITSFDGIARAQTSVIDEYNQKNQWRNAHPLRHLANEESDISKWAFPDANF